MKYPVFIYAALLLCAFGFSQEETAKTETRLRNINDYNKVENYIKEGEYGWYFPNGQLSAVNVYKDNKLDGVSKSFHENGMLRRYKNYVAGKFISGKCFDENGKQVAYYEDEIDPEFPGGKTELYKYIAKNVRQGNKDHGKIIVSFVIDQQGDAVDIMIVKGINEYIDNEVKRVIRDMPKWKPGTQLGVPVRALYSLPIILK